MRERPVALVTGSARRLGRAIALDLAANGWDVALHYRSSTEDASSAADEARLHGAAAETFAADLADEAACRALVPAVLRRFGRLRAVVNSAALFEYDAADSFSYQLMERHWRSNVGPAVVLATALHQHLQQSQFDGCVINLLDQKLWNPNPDYLSYTLSKAALEAANTLLAQALAPRVRVCAVAPGITLPSGPMSDSDFAAAHRRTPLHKSSTPADVAGAVRFLLEAPAITGTTLLVDGGQHLAAQPRDVMFVAKD
jgi:NAD(P)-dependent dehydrogenase (short-subunit alcohol dehydrogenase family)